MARFTDGNETLSHREWQDRLNMSFPVDNAPESLTRVYPEPPPEPTTEELASRARAKRDSLLSQSDWTQMMDSPLRGDQAWLGYRQALRDITNQAGFPDTIDWPVKPG